jgi:hypothetical protein
VAYLPLSRFPSTAHAQDIERFHHFSKGMTTMIGLLLFFAVISLMGAFGWTADSRDSADWKPTNDGTRAARWD